MRGFRGPREGGGGTREHREGGLHRRAPRQGRRGGWGERGGFRSQSRRGEAQGDVGGAGNGQKRSDDGAVRVPDETHDDETLATTQRDCGSVRARAARAQQRAHRGETGARARADPSRRRGGIKGGFAIRGGRAAKGARVRRERRLVRGGGIAEGVARAPRAAARGAHEARRGQVAVQRIQRIPSRRINLRRRVAQRRTLRGCEIGD